MNEFCPQCGTVRIGAFRFCRGCQFDYDTLESAPLEPESEALGATRAHAIAPGSPTVEPPRPRRRVRRYVVIGTAALLGLSGLSALATPTAPDAPTQPSRPTSTATALAPTAPATPAPPEAAFGPTSETQLGIVTRIVDGDTIRVEIDGVEYPVRYIGMDTPEPDAQEPAIKELADAATAANAALVDGREVILERDVSETDQFDRLLRDVWIEDDAGSMILVNLELIRQGFAQVSTYPPDVKYVDLLTDAQEVARTAEAGMWAPGPTLVPVPTHLGITDDQPRSSCDASYPDVCIPPYPPDLDCGQITERRFTVRGPDPHGFDSDDDGLGCESG